nr:M23 family metallopeptidase [Maliibacterium massiliense]
MYNPEDKQNTEQNGNENKSKRAKHTKRTFMRMVDRQGFIFVLVLCAGIVGVTAMWGASQIDKGPLAKTEPSAAQVEAPASPAKPTTAQAEPTFGVASAQAEETPQNTDVNASQDETRIKSFAMPVAGEVSKGFAMETLVYSSTLNEWNTHAGVDIKAEEGTQVSAVLDGTVKSVQQDPLMGNVITIEHAQNLTSVYAGVINVRDNVKAGAQLKAGDAIAQVGNAAASEAKDGAHLHFELHENGAPVDAQPYFQKES